MPKPAVPLVLSGLDEHTSETSGQPQTRSIAPCRLRIVACMAYVMQRLFLLGIRLRWALSTQGRCCLLCMTSQIFTKLTPRSLSPSVQLPKAKQILKVGSDAPVEMCSNLS